ncbi:MAG: hypothetical protein ACLFPH_09980 [Bacteroidales bacterium]
MKKLTFSVLAVFLCSFFPVKESNAIPAFARKYRLSCKTCHSPASPKLQDYGDSFAGSGFKLEDEESPRYYVPAGDDKLSLIRDFPIAIRMDGHVTYNASNNAGSDLGTPYMLKLLSGGEISEKISYYLYFYMDEQGEVAGVEDAILMYDNLFGTELDIVIGQFQVSDPLFKRELRLSLEDYMLYTSEIGMSDITLKYDRGIMLSYGFKTGTDVTFEIVNGNGIPEQRFSLFDKDKHKSYLGRISQSIGEYLSIGGFGYFGKEKQAGGQNEITNEVFIAGPDLSINLSDRFEFNFQYTYREDSETYLNTNMTLLGENVTTQGIMSEVIYAPQGDQSDWYLLGMYNKVTSDFDQAEYESITFHAGYLLRRNIRLASEYAYVLRDPLNGDEYGKFSVGVVSAF